jgi:hypothetical protein
MEMHERQRQDGGDRDASACRDTTDRRTARQREQRRVIGRGRNEPPENTGQCERTRGNRARKPRDE